MGPLNGIKVIEMEGLGPCPFAAMMLADMGADVLRISRKDKARFDLDDGVLSRGRKVVRLDLKQAAAQQALLGLCEGADILIEGFRPGVMERLGLGPEPCLAVNPRLVYGRMTGWGQTGPLAGAAGHDINYIALSGALHAIGGAEQPMPPLNLIGDFGGGAMFLAFGVLAGLIEAQRSGQGQVVDAAMTDGSAALMAMIYGLKSSGFWQDRRGANMLDGGAHFYGAYKCADGKFVAIGSIEPQFYAELLQRAGIDDPVFAPQMSPGHWPDLKDMLGDVFLQKTRDEWCALMEGSDVCFAPVLSLAEAPEHPHNQARGTFVQRHGITQPAPAPRFSRTAPEIRPGAVLTAQTIQAELAEWRISDAARQRLSAVIGG